MEAIGTHCIAELYDCPRHLLNDEAFVKKALREAVDEGLATLLGKVSHTFHPQGVTALGLLAESHIAIHTWPEYGYVGADVFTCGNRASAEKACRHLVRAFQPRRHSLKHIARGTDVLGEGLPPQPAAATCDASSVSPP